LPEHHPISAAKALASIDSLSNGRVLFGIGGGWIEEEMENHGVPFRQRWLVLREIVYALKAIWKDEDAEYHGRFVRFDPIRCFPKPVETPHPPILMSSDGPKTFDRIVEFCDGWLPIFNSNVNYGERISELNRRLEAGGRDPQSVSVTIYGVPPEREAIDALEKDGVSRVVLALPSASKDVVWPLVDRFASLIR
jgi:probable F420-dependent oxidoreductase